MLCDRLFLYQNQPICSTMQNTIYYIMTSGHFKEDKPFINTVLSEFIWCVVWICFVVLADMNSNISLH